MFENPFRPGAGHAPPYLAGRSAEQDDFKRLLKQRVISENLILTGLRGVGKTALLTTFQPIALQEGWPAQVRSLAAGVLSNDETRGQKPTAPKKK